MTVAYKGSQPADSAPSIVVGYDGSRGALAALDIAVGLGAAAGFDVTLLRANARAASRRPDADLDVPDGVRDRLAPHSVRARGAECVTTAAACIAREAEDGAAPLIAIGTRAENDSAGVMGGTAAEMLRIASLPVLFAPPETPRGKRVPLRMLVCIDRSDTNLAALSHAIAFARRSGARLHLRTVIESAEILEAAETYGYDPEPFYEEMRLQSRNALREAMGHAEGAGVGADTEVVDAPERVRGLLDEARRLDADLLVCARLLRAHRPLTGSTAQRLACRSPLPILVVPAGAARRASVHA